MKKVKSIRKILYVIFVAVWCFSFAVSLLEIFTYQGFVLKHIHLSVFGIVGITVVMGIIALVFNIVRFGLNLYSKLNIAATAGLTFIWLRLNYLESSHYPNYIYSNYHLYLEGLNTLLFLLFFTVVLHLIAMFWRLIAKNRNFFSFYVFRNLVIVIVFFIVLATNLLSIWRIFEKQLFFMTSHSNATYDQKMEESVGKEFYDYILFVKKNTPTNSTILIPPQGYPWPQSGNQFYMRYFLYPRKLVNGNEFDYGSNYSSNVNFILIDWGESSASQYGYTNGWPKFDIKSQMIIYWDGYNTSLSKSENYVYKKIEGQHLWGLIKVMK